MTILRSAALLLAGAGAIAIAGCGSSSSSSGPGGASATLRPPATPTAQDCDAGALQTNQRASNLVPAPGRYTYTVNGERREAGSSLSTSLPSDAPLIVTPSIHVGRLVCYRSQLRYTSKEADTITFAIRGGDVYITQLEFFAGGQTETLHPSPPIKALDGSGVTQWDGTFGGPTIGRYAGELLPRRPFTWSGKKMRALGVELRVSFSGQLRGTTRQETWVSPSNGTLFDQNVQQQRDFGGESVNLQYRSSLASFSAS